MTYEIAIEKLNQIIEKLSTESIPLADATSIFEEGMKLIKFCYEQLKSTKGKIFEIKKEMDSLKLEELE